MIKTSQDENSTKVRLKNSAAVKDVINATLLVFGALQSEFGSAPQLLKEAEKGYCFFEVTFLNELEDLLEL